MSAYDNDPRVVVAPDGSLQIWGVDSRTGRPVRGVVCPSTDGDGFDTWIGTPTNYASVDQAIRSLIGDPR